MKFFKGAALALGIFCAVCLTSAPARAALPEGVASKWKTLTEKLADATTLRDKYTRLPETAFLGADQKKTGDKITKLLRDAQEILLSADAMKLVKRAEVIKDRLPELNHEIEELRNSRISAPKSSHNPFKKTVNDVDSKIAKAEKDVARLEAELAEIHKTIAKELRSWGMKLTDEQAEVLFSTVVGDSILRNSVIFENVKGVTQQLAQLMTQNKNDTSTARKYYGMYITLIDVLLYTQHQFIEKIDVEWLPQVKKISDGATASLNEAKAALNRKDFTKEQRAIFSSNVASNELTVKAAAQYSKLLKQQKQSVQKCIVDLERDREVADNTYSTVQHISDMDAVVHSGLELFDVLSSMQMPDLVPFDNSSVRKEFEQITHRLEASSK